MRWLAAVSSMWGMWVLVLSGSGACGNPDSSPQVVTDRVSDSDSDSDDIMDGSDSNDLDTDRDSATETWDSLFVDRFDVDDDSDGFTNLEGDCHDLDPLIGPMALEDLGPDGLGDGVDNDCDGEIDEDETCDTEAEFGVTPDYLGKTATDLAAAMNMCDSRFLLSAEKIHSNTVNYDLAYDTFPRMGAFGCFQARQGRYLAAIATGPIWQNNANNFTPIDGNVIDAPDPQPLYQGDQYIGESSDLVCDVTQLRLHLRAPANAFGFSFDFLFASAEYPQYLNQGWNDTFYAILEHPAVNNGAPTNISFDSNGNEIEVDSNFFENDLFECDERQTGWDPGNPGGAGSTGWLRTTWNVEPYDEFYLTFSIHDEGDVGVGCGWDSIALLDNFRWLLHEVEITPGTTIILID